MFFDGAVLHYMVLVSVMPLVEFFDSFDSNVVVGIAFILIILPSVNYLFMIVMINNAKIKKLIINGCYKCTHLCARPRNCQTILLDNPDSETSSGDAGNGRRINEIICDV